MPLNQEEGLPDRYRRGESNALEHVYRMYVDGVSMILARGFVLDAHGGKRVPGVGSQEELKDLLQEVFVRAFSANARTAYDPTRPYRPYVHRIAKNLLVDHGRRLGRIAKLTAAISNETILVDEPELHLDERRRLDATTAFVASLDEPLRSLYAFRYVQGLSQVNVAIKMNRSRKQIRLLEEQLRAALRRLLNEQGLAPEVSAA